MRGELLCQHCILWVGKTEAEIENAIKSGVCINLESR